jgi:hypothetical protein
MKSSPVLTKMDAQLKTLRDAAKRLASSSLFVKQTEKEVKQ